MRQLDFGYDKVWNCLRIFSRSINWILAKTRFGIVLEYFRGDSIGIWLDKIWNCLRNFSRRFNWNLAKTQFGNVLEYLRYEAIGFWL